MITIALIILGTSLMYTGLLVYERELTAAVVVFAAGVALMIKPVIAVLHHFGLLKGIGSTTPAGGSPKRSGTPKARKKTHLRVVKPADDEEDQRPTIH